MFQFQGPESLNDQFYKIRFEQAIRNAAEGSRRVEDVIEKMVNQGFDHCPCGDPDCFRNILIQVEIKRRSNREEVSKLVREAVSQVIETNNAQIEVVVSEALKKYHESLLSTRIWKAIISPITFIRELLLYAKDWQTGEKFLEYESGVKERFDPEVAKRILKSEPPPFSARWGWRLGAWLNGISGNFTKKPTT
jgi:hypothetical protein